MTCKETPKLLPLICFISYFPPSEEGLACYTKELVDAIRKDYAESFRLCIIKQQEHEGTTVESMNGVAVYPVWNMASYKSSIASIVLTLLLVRKIRPDIIHLQYGPSRKYGGTLGEPFLFLLLFVKLFSSSKVFLSIHSLLYQRSVEDKVAKIVRNSLAGKIYAFYYKILLKYFFWLPNKVLVVTNCEFFSLSNECCSFLSYLSSGKNGFVKVIPHGIFESKYPPLARCTTGSNAKKLLLMGHIRQGRYDSVLKALGSASETLTGKLTVTVAGPLLFKQDEEYLTWLMQESKRLKIANFFEYNVKWLSDEEFANRLSVSDYTFVNFQEALKASGILSWAITLGVPAIVMMDETQQSKLESAPFLIAKDEHSLARILVRIVSETSLQGNLKATMSRLKTQYSFGKIAAIHANLYTEAIGPSESRETDD